ncbi:MAG: histidine kinase dimerization/phospho-acceptor domain-containing protein, partial [Eudoraea sp.]|uniref:histidine kinase dimerization/phospho-acceptor domain-containing protein n=1 Tax=Eudoraea sp. TaxID=1979955 RepID=UPI003C735701
MSTRLKKSYKFAFRSTLIITIILALSLSLFLFYQKQLEDTWLILLFFTIIVFAVTFITIQIRVEKYIYRRIKKIYDDVSLLESSSFTADPVTTDMRTLTEEIEKFAKDKKIEIDTLKIREEYRKDFLGNISHELKTPVFTVQGYILTLLDGALEDKAVRKKYLQRAQKGVERLIYIIKDLDLITKLEVGDL